MARRRTAGVRPRMLGTSIAADLRGHPRVGAPEQQARGLLSRHARLPVLQSVGEKGARRFASVGRGERRLLRRNPRRNAPRADCRAALSARVPQRLPADRTEPGRAALPAHDRRQSAAQRIRHLPLRRDLPADPEASRRAAREPVVVRRLLHPFAGGIAAVVPPDAAAHAGERGFVLLLPTGLYIAGGAAAVVVSFAVMACMPARLFVSVAAYARPIARLPQREGIFG